MPIRKVHGSIPEEVLGFTRFSPWKKRGEAVSLFFWCFCSRVSVGAFDRVDLLVFITSISVFVDLDRPGWLNVVDFLTV